MPVAAVEVEQRRTSAHGTTRPPSHVPRELFRAYTDLFHIAGHAAHGEVKISVDRDVGRVVHSLCGPSPASGGLRLPRSPTTALDAPGRFLYLLLRLVPGRPYALHADLTTSGRATHRLTVSNQFGGEAGAAGRARRTGVHVFLEAADKAWVLLAVDLAAVAVQATGGVGNGRPPGAGVYASLARLAFCSCCAVRGAFTSDLRYSWNSLPEDVGFAASFDALVAGARTVWVPEEPAEGSAKVAAPVRRAVGPLPPVPRRAALRRKQQQPADCSAADSQEHQSGVPQMHPEPIAELAFVSGFAARCSQPLVWAPVRSEVLFAASNVVVAMKPMEGGAQRCLGGTHARPVVALAISGNGALLASAEEGPEGTVQLWTLAHGQPLVSLAHGGAIICLSLSADGGALLTAGVSAGGRQELAWWDVSACCTGGSACQLARQRVEHSVLAATFHPYLPDLALTCGKNSVRVHRQVGGLEGGAGAGGTFWSLAALLLPLHGRTTQSPKTLPGRLQDGQLRGVSVPMDGVRSPRRRPYSCGTLASATSTSVGEVSRVAWPASCNCDKPCWGPG